VVVVEVVSDGAVVVSDVLSDGAVVVVVDVLSDGAVVVTVALNDGAVAGVVVLGAVAVDVFTAGAVTVDVATVVVVDETFEVAGVAVELTTVVALGVVAVGVVAAPDPVEEGWEDVPAWAVWTSGTSPVVEIEELGLTSARTKPPVSAPIEASGESPAAETVTLVAEGDGLVGAVLSASSKIFGAE
jgi:hypothetical protein